MLKQTNLTITNTLLLKVKILSILFFVAIGMVLAVFLTKNLPASQALTNEAIIDQNNDGIINLTDARIIAPPATTNCVVCVDVDSDKTITDRDVNLILYNASLSNSSEGINSNNSRFDINNDGVLSDSDASIAQNYIGQTVTSPVFGLDNPSELVFGYVVGEVLVKFKPQAAGSEKGSLASKYNLIHKGSFPSINAEHYGKEGSDVENLQKQLNVEPSVEKAYKNHVGEFHSNDPYWNDQWGHKKIRIEQTWYTETTGNRNSPVKVVVIDTGIDVDHPDLRQNLSSLRRNAGETSSSDPDYTNVDDTTGHGTLMSGIIGATVDNNKAIAGLVHHVEIIPVKAGLTLTDSLIGVGFEWAMAQSGVKVINMSFGMGYGNSNDFLTSSLLRQAREDLGITLIASAGNNGRDECEYPANHQNVVCVGATQSNDAICNYSSGQQDADIFAPGDNIVSTYPISLDSDGIRFAIGCHTSPAAAHISGVAALCRTVRPLPESIEITREDLKCRKFDNQGYGRVDAWATIWYRNCHKFDFDSSGRVDILDAQNLAFRVNSPNLYNARYDIAPVGTNGKIDIADALLILARTNLDCPPR